MLNSIVAETFSVEGDVVGLQEETQTAEPDVTLLSTWLEIYQFQLPFKFNEFIPLMLMADYNDIMVT